MLSLPRTSWSGRTGPGPGRTDSSSSGGSGRTRSSPGGRVSAGGSPSSRLGTSDRAGWPGVTVPGGWDGCRYYSRTSSRPPTSRSTWTSSRPPPSGSSFQTEGRPGLDESLSACHPYPSDVRSVDGERQVRTKNGPHQGPGSTVHVTEETSSYCGSIPSVWDQGHGQDGATFNRVFRFSFGRTLLSRRLFVLLIHYSPPIILSKFIIITSYCPLGRTRVAPEVYVPATVLDVVHPVPNSCAADRDGAQSHPPVREVRIKTNPHPAGVGRRGTQEVSRSFSLARPLSHVSPRPRGRVKRRTTTCESRTGHDSSRRRSYLRPRVRQKDQQPDPTYLPGRFKERG